MLTSLHDETPEGKSIVELARQARRLDEPYLRERAVGSLPIKFTAETRSSGTTLADGLRLRKGASDAIRHLANAAGQAFPNETTRRWPS